MSSISSTSSSNPMGSLRAYAIQMANKQRPDPANATSVTSTQVRSDIKSTTGVDIDATAKTVDTDGDRRLTTSELARAESKKLTEATTKLDPDGNLTKSEVTSRLQKANKERDTNGDGKASKDENGAYATKVAAQLDSQYTGTRLKGLSHEEVYSQRSSVSSVGNASSVMHGNTSYEYSKADQDGDGRISTTEGEEYVANKSGLSDDVSKVKTRQKTEKDDEAEQDKKAEKSDSTNDTTKTSKTDNTQKKSNTSYEQSDATVGRQILLARTYGATYTGERSGSLNVSA